MRIIRPISRVESTTAALVCGCTLAAEVECSNIVRNMRNKRHFSWHKAEDFGTAAIYVSRHQGMVSSALQQSALKTISHETGLGNSRHSLVLFFPRGGCRAVLAERARPRAHLGQEVHERARQRVLLEPIMNVHAALLAPDQPRVL